MKLNIILFVMGLMLFVGTDNGLSSSGDLVVVSAERGENGVYGIYLKTRKGGRWVKDEVISITAKHEIHPTIVRNNDNGDMMLAWTRFTGSDGKIHSRFFSAESDAWGPVQSLNTETTSDMGPALARDESGKIWLAYSGTGKNGDDIYVSCWNENYWSIPVMVNSGDSSPDIQPRFSYGESGELQLLWKGFLDGKYVYFGSDLTAGTWSVEHQVSQGRNKRQAVADKAAGYYDIHEKFSGRSQAAVWETHGQGLLAVPVMVNN